MSKLLRACIDKAIFYHRSSPKTPKNAVRGHDNITPYWIHPVGGAMMIMEDNNGENLTLQKRLELAISFLFHDVIEDTTVDIEEIRYFLNGKLEIEEEIEKIIANINDCTLDEGLGSMDEYRILKEKDQVRDEIWYLKTVDKSWNLMGSTKYFKKKGKLEKYCEFLDFLSLNLENSKFSDSLFVDFSKSLINRDSG